ncbi:hypothetical protein [Azohydromonas australica]|uniref:hypothetical protein n=1 Tax=Azohydromonas australica TaxID=364039 RepID=UPI000419C296|nr:hypothetical protein [Azohydromonas australica]
MDYYHRDIDSETTISNDGLRYTAKIPGSGFGPVMLGGYSTMMSCLRCGCHKRVAELVSKKILGRNQKVCAVNCRKRD